MNQPPCSAQEETGRIRLQASDTRFFAAFQGSYQTFRAQPLTEDSIYAAFHRSYRDPNTSPRWKAGRIAGWFAALYHVPCRFDETGPGAPAPHPPRAIELQITEPRFVDCYQQGYQDAVQRTPVPFTDDALFGVLDQAYLTYACGRQSLTAMRCCAGYLAGWFAAFYGLRVLVAPSSHEQEHER